MPDTKIKDHYSTKIAELDQTTATYGFLRKSYEEAIDNLRQDIDNNIGWINPEGTAEGVIYQLFEQWGIFEETDFQSKYKLDADTKEVEILEERLDQHFDNSYDKSELVGILKAHSEDGQPPSARELRRNDQTPTENPFKHKFGSLSNAYWHAGLEPRQRDEADKEIVEEEYLKAVHQANQDRDILLEAPSISEEFDYHKTYRNHFDSAEELRKETGTDLVKEIEKELRDWNEAINQNISIDIHDQSDTSIINISQYIDEFDTDLKPVYPKIRFQLDKY